MPDDSLDALYKALDDKPDDQVTIRALADWYEEHDNQDAAECLRWTAEEKKHPFLYKKRGGGVSVSCKTWHDKWLWWAIFKEGEHEYGNDWGHSPECRLPPGLWDKIKHTFDYDPAVFKEYPSRRAAYEALFEAWPAFRP